MQSELNPALRVASASGLLVLIALCVAWEWFLAPLRPGGTLLFLKALPLLFAVRGVSRGDLYTCQWTSMLVLLYLMEGLVRVVSDTDSTAAWLAGMEVGLSAAVFVCLLLYVRPAKRAARQRQSVRIK